MARQPKLEVQGPRQVIVGYEAKEADLHFEGKVIKLFSKLGYFCCRTGREKVMRMVEFRQKKG